MEAKNNPGWESVAVTVFCLLASFEAGHSFREIAPHISGLKTVAYAVGEGIFIALSSVLFYVFLSSFRKK